MKLEPCDWCRDPSARRLVKVGLCKRCNTWRRAAQDARGKLGTENTEQGADPMRADFSLWIALKMPEIARREGLRFGSVSEDEIIPGLDLENELRYIAEAATGKPMYYGQAGTIDHDLSLSEQQKVLSLLAPLGRAIFRKHARRMASEELIRAFEVRFSD